MIVSVSIKFYDFTLFFFLFSYHPGYTWAVSIEHHLAIIAEIALVSLLEQWSDAVLSCSVANLFMTDEAGRGMICQFM